MYSMNPTFLLLQLTSQPCHGCLLHSPPSHTVPGLQLPVSHLQRSYISSQFVVYSDLTSPHTIVKTRKKNAFQIPLSSYSPHPAHRMQFNFAMATISGFHSGKVTEFQLCLQMLVEARDVFLTSSQGQKIESL